MQDERKACPVCEGEYDQGMGATIHGNNCPMLASPPPETTSSDIIGAWRREMVRAICRQQSENPSFHICKCMAPDGIGFGHFPAALLCRDTYDEIIDALTPIITQAKAKWQAEAFEMAAKVAEESADQCGDCMDGFCTMNCSSAPIIMKVSYP